LFRSEIGKDLWWISGFHHPLFYFIGPKIQTSDHCQIVGFDGRNVTLFSSDVSFNFSAPGTNVKASRTEVCRARNFL
jgi:hypothetical protein